MRSRSARESKLEIGSEHELAAATSGRVRVVGRVILDLGDGADSAEVLADQDALEAIGTEPLLQVALVKLRSERASEAARAETMDVIHGRSDSPFTCGDDVVQRFLPDLAAPPEGDEPCIALIGSQLFNTVDVLPLTRVISIFLAVVGAAVLAQGLVLAGRRRRGEVAVLRSMGFDRRQVVTSSIWLGLSVAVAAITLGMVTGVALGRVAGGWASRAIGVLPGPDLPWLTLGLIALGTVVVAVGSSIPIGLSSLRRSPAAQLRSE